MLPSEVTIGYQTFDVSDWQPGPDETDDGRIDYDRLTILIREPMNDRDRANTLLHEIMHGCWHYGTLHHGEVEEERAILTLTNMLCQVMRENPDVFAWLMAQLSDRA